MLAAGKERPITITIDYITITINLLPGETERLTGEARAQGLTLEEYVRGRLVPDKPAPKRKISDLRGLGKEIWQGVDVKKYLDDLRDESNYSELQRFDRK